MRRAFNQLGAWLYRALPGLGQRWAKRFQVQTVAAHIPWTAVRGTLAQQRISLITTGGVHLRSDPAFDMHDPHGDPSFRLIPADTKPNDLIITHDYYDHRDADRDVNIVLPISHFQQLAAQGTIQQLGPCYSFMGHITDEHIDTLINQTAPAVARNLRAAGITAAVLTPA
ncbi:glycine/sarcosine/betaine reductase selenoprotein B family protein [Herpetosiphon llansteffanensis]|uniref:glycine/sarcosine/betaine reductase selenoprotein B family protein n=1 Tax=Herpetosiphon llansteffanensis TaxID=2094568 RepID=UPI0013DF679C|nr:glycine/sarcosine/betaine reductase selenoprotein B family protein [Herpetosiphon llansteffanensis]